VTEEERAPNRLPLVPPPPGRSLPQAIATAAVLLAAVGGAGLAGAGGFFVLICVAVAVALFEVFDALTVAGNRPVLALGLAGALGLQVAGYAERLELGIAVAGACTLVAFLAALRPSRGPAPMADVGWTVLGVVWIGGGGAGATGIVTLEDGVALMTAYLLVAAAVDIAAYFVGRGLGRRRLAPSISPAKSWEGALGGLVAALGAGLAAGALLDSLTLADGLAVGAICGLLAPVGDLVESLFKREMGIKDSGRLLPGHGGVLDRLDAIIFCAPFVFVYLLVALD
jgi:phosphatidate cytidylyltransferase